MNESPWRGVINAAGGSLLLSDLLTEPGASNTVIFANVPYAYSSLGELLRYRPDQACSPQTATNLAREAWLKAQHLEPDQKCLFGFGLTASLSSNRPKRGEHRAFIALHTQSKTWNWSIHLEKNRRTRLEEERYVADVAANNLTSALGLEERKNSSTERISMAPPELAELIQGTVKVNGSPRSAFLPGSFNPVHEGHRRMKAIAEAKLGTSVQFELCIENVDKPSLDYIEVAKRQSQFKPSELILTNQRTFLGKASALAKQTGCTFVVGVDTFERIIDPRYYPSGTVEERDSALKKIRDLDCSFLVFGRFDGHEFVTLSKLEVPSNIADSVRGLPEDEFRLDVSSTSIRAGTHKPVY